MAKYDSDPLSATFSALADPTRRAILARLALGETDVVGKPAGRWLAAPRELALDAESEAAGDPLAVVGKPHQPDMVAVVDDA